MKLFLAGLIAGAMALTASSAMAVTATIDTTPDFADLATYASSTGGGTLLAASFTTNQTNVVLSPFSGTPQYGATYYASGPAVGTQPDPAVLTFTELKSVFSFLYGSPDLHNTITFYNGVSVVGTLSSFLSGYGPGIFISTGAIFVTVTDILFDSVTFTASNQAVEFSSISTVPIPAGLALLGGGIAILGFLGTRRKRNVASA